MVLWKLLSQWLYQLFVSKFVMPGGWKLLSQWLYQLFVSTFFVMPVTKCVMGVNCHFFIEVRKNIIFSHTNDVNYVKVSI